MRFAARTLDSTASVVIGSRTSDGKPESAGRPPRTTTDGMSGPRSLKSGPSVYPEEAPQPMAYAEVLPLVLLAAVALGRVKPRGGQRSPAATAASPAMGVSL